MSFGEAFLQLPDLFPARHAGEPWGDDALSLDLPGGPYRCHGLDRSQHATVLRRFGSWIADAELEAVAEIEIFRAANEDFRPIPARGWTYSIDFDHSPASVRLAGLRFMARLDLEAGLRTALWTSEGSGSEFEMVFENCLRCVVAYRVLELDGVLLHSAGAVDGARAHVLFGRSGAGKTTAARQSLAAERTVLSDDLNAVLPGQGGFVAASLPFSGELGSSSPPHTTAPLAGLYRLEKRAVDTLQPLSRAQALASLVSCSPFVNHDGFRVDRLLGTLQSVVDTVPVSSLGFNLDGGFWRLISEGRA